MPVPSSKSTSGKAKFYRWKIIFIGHEEKACFAAYAKLENKSQTMQSHLISEKTKSHLVVHEALVVVSWEKSSEVSAMFVNLARNALYLFFAASKSSYP